MTKLFTDLTEFEEEFNELLKKYNFVNVSKAYLVQCSSGRVIFADKATILEDKLEDLLEDLESYANDNTTPSQKALTYLVKDIEKTLEKIA